MDMNTSCFLEVSKMDMNTSLGSELYSGILNADTLYGV